MVDRYDKGYRGEVEYAALINKVFGSKAERISGSREPGKRGDVQKRSLPKILQEYQPEVKNQATIHIPQWVRQAQDEFHSLSMWHLAIKVGKLTPSKWVIVQDGLEWLGLMCELQGFREKNTE